MEKCKFESRSLQTLSFCHRLCPKLFHDIDTSWTRHFLSFTSYFQKRSGLFREWFQNVPAEYLCPLSITDEKPKDELNALRKGQRQGSQGQAGKQPQFSDPDTTLFHLGKVPSPFCGWKINSRSPKHHSLFELIYLSSYWENRNAHNEGSGTAEWVRSALCNPELRPEPAGPRGVK